MIAAFYFNLSAIYGASEDILPEATTALALFQEGKIEEAAKKIEQELAEVAADKKGSLLETKGRIQLAQHKPKQALQSLNQALDANPNLIMAPFYMGEAEFQQKHWPEALSTYAHVLSEKKIKDPRDVLLKVIYCQVAVNRLSEAGQMLNKFDLFDGQHPGYYFAKAAIARATGKAEGAQAMLSQVQTLYGLPVFNRYQADYFSLIDKSSQSNSAEKR